MSSHDEEVFASFASTSILLLAMRCSTWLDQVGRRRDTDSSHFLHTGNRYSRESGTQYTRKCRLNLSDKEMRFESWLWKIKRLWRNVAH